MTLCLSIRQPWANAIFDRRAGKDVENRTWPTKVRGRILIHAAAKKASIAETTEFEAVAVRAIGASTAAALTFDSFDLLLGGIIGEAEIVDCVTKSDSPWFFGPYGFALQNARRLPFRPLRGRLGFFSVDESSLYPEAREE